MTRAFAILLGLVLIANQGCASPGWNWLRDFQGTNSDDRYIGTSPGAQADHAAQLGQYRQQGPAN